MYYTGYALNKKSVGLLHNIGLLFFSLQSVVSFGMAMTKPDVRKSIYDLYYISFGWIIDWCHQRHPKSKDTRSNINVTKTTMGEHSEVAQDRNGEEEKEEERIDPETAEMWKITERSAVPIVQHCMHCCPKEIVCL